MARNLFAILDDLTANLAELKAALAPLALIGGDGRGRGKEARQSATSREENGSWRHHRLGLADVATSNGGGAGRGYGDRPARGEAV